MGIWDSLRRITRRTPNGRPGIQKKASGRGKQATKRRDLRLEQFEDRILLSITPAAPDNYQWERMLESSIARAADLEQYSEESLGATDQWVVGLGDGIDSKSMAISLGADSISEAGLLPGGHVWEFSTLVGWSEAADRYSK